MAKPSKSRPLSKAERAEIRALLDGPQNAHEVADQFSCDVRQITGIWNSARNGLGRKTVLPETQVLETTPAEDLLAEEVASLPAALPPVDASAPSPGLEPAAVTGAEEELSAPESIPPVAPSEAQSMTQPRPPGQRVPQAPPGDPWYGFNVIQQATPAPGTPIGPVPQLPTFRVERLQPHDGYLGTHTGTFDPNMLGVTYGGGLYQITIQVPGRHPMISQERISEGMYGPAKFPKVTRLQDDDRDFREPHSGGGRYGGDGRSSPGYRGPYDPYYGGARGGPGGSENATTEAIRQMGTLQQTVISEISKARDKGPDAFFHDFYRTQNQHAQQIREEERRREEDRRREERDRDETRRREEAERSQRERDFERQRHSNDMERIRLESDANANRILKEREALLKFEEEKRQTLKVELDAKERAFLAETKAREDVLRKETELREKNYQAELERSRKSVEDMRKQVSFEMKDQSERNAREYDLRKQNLDTQHKLLGEKLELEKQIATANTTEGLVRGFKEIVGEVGRRLEAVLEYKKMELGYKNPPGNVTDIPQGTPAPKESQAAAEQPRAEEPQPVEEPKDMEQIIGEYLRDPGLRSILTEWSRQIELGVPPSAFANFFVEAMSSEDSPSLRRATKALDMFMRTRNWAEMLKTLEPHLQDAEREVMKGAHAEDYYEGFRGLVAAEVDAYWEQMALRRAEQQAQKAGNASGTPAPAK